MLWRETADEAVVMDVLGARHLADDVPPLAGVLGRARPGALGYRCRARATGC